MPSHWPFVIATTDRRTTTLIALLRGIVHSRHENHVVLDVQGVGYRIFMSVPAIQALPSNEELTIDIHTHVREDALSLYGFQSETEREIFLRLTTVSGIGPKLGMNILSGSSIDELVGAVTRGDVKSLTAIPGVGKKTAERILVELRDVFHKLMLTDDTLSSGPTSAGSAPTGMFADVASALANLGFKNAQIEKTLSALNTRDTLPDNFDDLLREALQQIR